MPTQNVKILFITKLAHSHIDTENQMPNRLPYSIIIRLALTYWTIKCNTITTSKEEKKVINGTYHTLLALSSEIILLLVNLLGGQI